MASQDRLGPTSEAHLKASRTILDTSTSDQPEPAKSEDEKTNASSKDADHAVEAKISPNPRLQALATKKANLEATLASLQAQKSALVAEAKLPSGLAMPDGWSEQEKTKSPLTTANGVIKEHIALLHRYNEIKDVGQGLMGMIADKRGVRVATVMEDYGMDEKD